MLNVSATVNGEMYRTEQVPSDTLFPFIAKILSEAEIPSRVEFSINGGLHGAGYSVQKRGTYVENGVTHPSRFITEDYCDIPDVYVPRTTERYLTCIHPESNNYKMYHFIPTRDGWTAEYGRIGSNPGEKFGLRRLNDEMPNRMFHIRYMEKLSKGYVDQTDIFLSGNGEKSERDTESGEETVDSALWDLLQSYARRYIKETLVNSAVTEEQVRSAKSIFRNMIRCKTVNGFNGNLRKLLVLSPRRVEKVQELLATDEAQFPGIVEREERLLLAMEAVVQPKSAKRVVRKENTPFAWNHVSIFEATEKQRADVVSRLDRSMQNRVSRVWRVIPHRQQDAFNAYLKKEGIKEVKRMWHGSRNENWLSIILNGLSLNPNAVITGKMFGNGIYFAPSSTKSLGYTSTHGSRWAHGSSACGYMGLYATAYGKPYETKVTRSFSQRDMSAFGTNCVHARAGNVGLLNDEIIFYDEAAMVLNYLVEIK